ncbi:unnamed protein product [Acanthoscelides obtectus]|uniref:Uncharacterized protein n=1 Tax=Acanthoscelides obtectus TaxID=200917 RepID=A0A9P0P9E1_ACAOB|nr:unnamed protein product [Acanthoscelides obtectus]CAK1669340.1 hypothetical protein AOBTE_LOCUS26962 [Acanthoscelides obtectus]
MLYSYKPLNLNRNPLRLGIFLRKPHFYKDENGMFVGDDRKVFELFTYSLNASLEIKVFPNTNNFVDDIAHVMKRGELDIMGNRLAQLFYVKDVDYSFPISRDDKYFVVPKPQLVPAELHVIFMFTQAIWVTLLSTLIVLTIFVSIVYKKSPNYSFLIVWGILFCVSQTIFQIKTRGRYVLILWIYGSYILSSSFQGNLMKFFLHNRYGKGIKTLEDLKESGLKIGIVEYYIHTSNLTKDLCVKKQYVEMSESERVEGILRGQTSYAYFLGEYFAKLLIEECMFKNCGGRLFETMPQAVFPCATVYHLQRQSIFTAKLDRFILILQSSGLMKHRKQWKHYVPEQENVLRMFHFKAAFKLLLLGYFLSISLLVLELIIWKYVKYKSKANRA